MAVGLLCVGLLNVSAAGEVNPLIGKLKRAIARSGAEVSIEFQDLEAFEAFGINPVDMHAASLMKVPVMIEVFKQAEQGKYSLDDKIIVTNEFKSIVDGSPYSLTIIEDSDDDIYRHIGKEMSLRELVYRMITVSSNLATNVLIEFVGVENIRSTLTEWGIQKMKVLRGVEDIKAYEKGLNNRTDASSMMLILKSIAEGRAASDKACKEMIEILSRQEYRNKIPAGLPADVRVANKTGSITRIDHDAAIVFPEGRKPYILVVLTRGIEKRADAEKLIAELSRIVYDFVTKK
ncbi:MAG: serine hydrolase [Candidatus Aminicenantes bacterium]|nr:MAG: serine hydrolase [Candidatus Aminicenantes bacterium]